MTFGSVPAVVRADSLLPDGDARATHPDVAARNREVVGAVQALSESGTLVAEGELRYSIERESGHLLVRIVDPVTGEVIRQVPSETVLEMAKALRELASG